MVLTMKAIFPICMLSLLSFSVVVAEFDKLPLPQSIVALKRTVRMVTFSGHERVKRYGAQCVAGCTQRMAAGMKDIAETTKTASGIIPKNFNETQFNQLCSFYVTGKRCLNRCPYSRLKQLIKRILKPTDYLCVEHKTEFLTHQRTCYSKIEDEVTDTCDPKCGDQSVLEEVQRQTKVAKANRDWDKISNIFYTLCQFMGCHLSCSRQIILSKCQQRAPSDFLVDFASTALTQAESILEQGEVSHVWPPICSRVAAGDLTTDFGNDS